MFSPTVQQSRLFCARIELKDQEFDDELDVSIDDRIVGFARNYSVKHAQKC